MVSSLNIDSVERYLDAFSNDEEKGLRNHVFVKGANENCVICWDPELAHH